MKHSFYRGEIYYADLNPIVGSEQGGIRPVLILQNNVGNHFASTVIVAAITSRINAKPRQPTHSFIGMVGAMKYPSVVMLEQLRTLDKCCVGPYVGSLSDEKMEVHQPRYQSPSSKRSVIGNGKIVYPQGSSRAFRHQYYDLGCRKKQWTDLLCAVCTKRLRFLYQCRLTGVCRQVYTQGKAHGKEKHLPKCAEG